MPEPGERAGILTFVRNLDITGTNRKILIRCDCGKEFESYRSNWGRTKSCGCLHRKIFVGSKFTRLTVLKKSSEGYWYCRCDCGTKKRIHNSSLLSETTLSCGCLRAETIAERSTTHGMTKTTEYKIWHTMLQRCLNPNATAYERYGGKGVLPCDAWMEFETFFSDMGKRPSKAHTLDRINNVLGYNPDNCRWATWEQQQNNRHNARKYTHNGETLSIAQWERRMGWRNRKLWKRLDRGWSFERAITTP